MDEVVWPEALDCVEREPFRVEVAEGVVVEFPHPRDLTAQEFAESALDLPCFVRARCRTSMASARVIADAYRRRYRVPGPRGVFRIQRLVTRYRPELVADLQSVGVDLAQWYADRRWQGILDVVNQLPSASRLYEAMANDPEEAAVLARLRMNNDDAPEWSPRVSEFDLTAHLLRDLIHEVRLMRAESVQMQGGKAGEIRQIPAPRTAIDAEVERLEKEWTTDFLGKLGFDETYI